MRISLLTTLTLLALPAWASPPIFQDLDFTTALDKAADQRLLIVDATAQWCGPCKNMDRTTWIDAGLVSYLEEHAIAIQFDVDEHPDLAEELRAFALPTIIAFKDGEEADRVVGYKTASQMIEWLDHVREGVSTIDLLREQVGKTNWRGKPNIDARKKLAYALFIAGEHDDATGHYAWLWDNMLEFEPGQRGVRRSFMAGDIAELVQAHEPALARFTDIRDRTQAALEHSPGWDLLKDWLTLNDIVADPGATLAWIDRVLAQDGGFDTIKKVEFMVDDLLIDQGRYDITGRLLDDPLAALRRDHELAGKTSMVVSIIINDDSRANLRDSRLRRFRYRAAVLHAAALASGNPNTAWKLLDEIFLLEDSIPMRTQLVRHAHAAGVLTDRHLALLYPDRLEEHADLIEEINNAEDE